MSTSYEDLHCIIFTAPNTTLYFLYHNILLSPLLKTASVHTAFLKVIDKFHFHINKPKSNTVVLNKLLLLLHFIIYVRS